VPASATRSGRLPVAQAVAGRVEERILIDTRLIELSKFQLTPEKPVERYSDDAATTNVRKWGACDIVVALSPNSC
jgi:hypothetical protein